jgi:DMSO/TMAO reductase YedYZ molybdopterin-dependent catalytic subunit
MFGRKKALPTALDTRIPPGQTLTEKWPVLHYGSVPRVNLATWDFRIVGLVEEPVTFTFKDFAALPRARRMNDIHCVTRWSKLDNTWEGVAVQEVLSRVRLKPEARFVMVHAEQGFTANLPMSDFDRPENLFAFTHNAQPLAPEHGYPVRLVVPHLYFWKSVKWVRGLELIAKDAPGFWERNGYHMRGDPWTEERYSSWW